MLASNSGLIKHSRHHVHEEVDVEQGERNVFLREGSECTAMDDSRRCRLRLKTCFQSLCACRRSKNRRKEKEIRDGEDPSIGRNGSYDVDEIAEDIEGWGPKQYRLERVRKAKKKSLRKWLISLVTCCFTDLLQNNSNAGISLASKRCLVNTVHWAFRVSFVPLLVLMCVVYYSASIAFAGLIMAAGELDPTCLRIGTGDFKDYGSRFFDAFALSWNTFATTGYGAIYPALGSQNKNRSHCLFLSIICSVENFLGVLYIGFCAAILFGKVMRTHSHAQVIFSDPIVIQYGSDAADDEPDEELPTEDDTNESETRQAKRKSGSATSTTIAPRKDIPLPVLEFRVVNKLFNEQYGEIIDANINVVANIDAHDIDTSLRNLLDPEVRWRRTGTSALHSLKKRTRQNGPGSSETDSDVTEFLSTSSDQTPGFNSTNRRSRRLASSLRVKFFDPFASIQRHPLISDHQRALEEDPVCRLVGKRIFVKLNIEASSHPFFKRVWLARHVLDETSPIVKPNVRRRIRRLGGCWPENLNSCEGVRESLLFDQILVSLTGIANISASTVYAQKIYDFADINVGYQFVNIIYRDSEGTLQLRADLINDVREQKGGGGEPLILDNSFRALKIQSALS